MLVSTETLSLVMPRAGPVEGGRQKASHSSPNSLNFEKVFDEARVETNQPAAFRKNAGNSTREEHIAEKREKVADGKDDGSVVGAATGDHNAVVVILEGDKESNADLETRVEAAAMPVGLMVDDGLWQIAADGSMAEMDGSADPIDRTANVPTVGAADLVGAEIAAYPADAEIAADMRDGLASASAPTEPAGAERAESESAASGVINGVSAKAAPVETEDNEAGGTLGEVVARMPIIRTSEQSDMENKGDEEEFSENGNLSPLGNENDKTAVKSRKEKAYSETGNRTATTSKDTGAAANIAQAPIIGDIKPERFIAGQRLSAQATGTPVRTESLFDEIVSRIETSTTDSMRSMTIQLKPEFLGKVALEIAMDATGLHVKISAADQGVRSMVNGQINALIETLQNKGIEVVEVEVAYTGVNNGAFSDSKGGQSHPNSPRGQRIAPAAADDSVFYAALPFDALEYYLEDGVSSVEYRA
jgi:flagellar hook-length control protein FliK